MQYKRWEIWWADVKYEDAPETVESRPVLVVTQQEIFIIAFKMTGTKRVNDYPITDWQGAGLSKETHIRADMKLKLLDSDLTDKIGSLQPRDIIGFQKHITKNSGPPSW